MENMYYNDPQVIRSIRQATTTDLRVNYLRYVKLKHLNGQVIDSIMYMFIHENKHRNNRLFPKLIRFYSIRTGRKAYYVPHNKTKHRTKVNRVTFLL